jgi:translation elongation factor P/translation initiation factor 5A
MQVSTAEFRKGLKIELDGQPYNIVEFQHVKPGKGGAFVRTKLKHLRLGRVVDRTFRAGEKVGWSSTEQRSMQYLYKDDNFHFAIEPTSRSRSPRPPPAGSRRRWRSTS